MNIEPDNRPIWERFQTGNLRHLASRLRRRGRPIVNIAAAVVVAGMVLAPATQYDLDPNGNVRVRSYTVDKTGPQHIVHAYDTFLFLTTTGANTWTVPSDWNNADNKVECIGGGGSGGALKGSNAHASGGSGGAYAAKTNIVLTPGGSVNYTVGEGGTPVTTGNNGVAGGDTFFNGTSLAGSSVGAVGGPAGKQSGTSASSGGIADAANCVGSVRYSGGKAGFAGSLGQNATGGGGAAGPHGDGGDSGSATSSSQATNGGTADGGNTASNTAGSQFDATHGCGGGGNGQWINSGSTPASSGKAYGGGGGGCCGSNTASQTTSGAGYQGLIFISYTASLPAGIQFRAYIIGL